MDRVGDYRGITILPSPYRIYASILGGKLERETEEKRCIPENQTGFRRKGGTIENIYVLNHIVGRELKKKGGTIVALFMDLKAAFDTVDRRKLWEAMEKAGIDERLRKRVQEIYLETKSRVRIGQEIGKEFWTSKGVRQGCPLSPGLFNIFTVDLEGVLMATDEEGMKGMIGRLERYLSREGLELNVGKTKIMRFQRGGGRRKEVRWEWKEEEMEEVKEFKYLGFTLHKNGRMDAHISKR